MQALDRNHGTTNTNPEAGRGNAHVASLAYVTTKVSSRTATIAMRHIQAALNKTIAGLSDQNYDQSLAFVRLWLEIGQTHSVLPPDAVLGALRAHRSTELSDYSPIDPTAHLILRFASDAEPDQIVVPHSIGLRSRLCAETLQQFFDTDLGIVYSQCGWDYSYFGLVNLVAHCINLGYVDEAVIRSHILQSLISHSKLHNHQAYALFILFKIAGATFAAYTDPTVVDRCFELLRVPRDWPKQELIQVNALSVKGKTLGLRKNYRWSLGYGSAAGRVSLPRPYSEPGIRNRLARTGGTLLRLQLSPPWDSQTEILNLRSHSPHNSSRSLPQSQTRFLDPPSRSLRPSALPACPTSQSQIPPMTSPPSTPRL